MNDSDATSDVSSDKPGAKRLGGGVRRRGRRLATAAHVKAALAHLYRELEAGTIDVPRARALVYCAATLSSVLQASDFEARLAALEASAGVARQAEP
jgi:hypothetical protein